MNKQQIEDNATQVVRTEIRAGKFGHYADAVLEWLPKIVSTVDVDKKMIVDCVKKAAFDASNPINSALNRVLGILGVQLISERNLVQNRVQQNVLDKALNLDNDKLRIALQGMASDLEKIENDAVNHEKEMQDTISKLHAQLDAVQQEKTRAQNNYTIFQKRVADRLQYILALIGPEANENPAYLQIQEMVTDMGAKIVWDSGNGQLAERVMFQFYKVDKPEDLLKKPCIISGDTVLVQGVMPEITENKEE